MVVFGLGKDVLFKYVLWHCDIALFLVQSYLNYWQLEILKKASMFVQVGLWFLIIQTYVTIILFTLGWLSFSNTYIIKICLFFQVLKILVQTNEDRLFVVFNNGLSLLYEAFNMLQMMFHEATACHVTTEVRFFLQLSNLFFSKISKKNVLSLDKWPN